MPGPKTRYLDEKEIDQLETMAGYRMSQEQIASVIGISRRSLINRMEDQPGVREAWDRGQSIVEEKIKTALMREGVEKGDVKALVFLAKNFANMTDGHSVTIEEKGPTSRENLRKAMAQLMGQDPNDPASGLEPEGDD